jgi:hypothetical protein
MRLKVGSTVRRINKDFNGVGILVGDIGIVIKIYSHDNPKFYDDKGYYWNFCQVRFFRGVTVDCNITNLEVVEDKNETENS